MSFIGGYGMGNMLGASQVYCPTWGDPAFRSLANQLPYTQYSNYSGFNLPGFSQFRIQPRFCNPMFAFSSFQPGGGLPSFVGWQGPQGMGMYIGNAGVGNSPFGAMRSGSAYDPNYWDKRLGRTPKSSNEEGSGLKIEDPDDEDIDELIGSEDGITPKERKENAKELASTLTSDEKSGVRSAKYDPDTNTMNIRIKSRRSYRKYLKTNKAKIDALLKKMPKGAQISYRRGKSEEMPASTDDLYQAYLDSRRKPHKRKRKAPKEATAKPDSLKPGPAAGKPEEPAPEKSPEPAVPAPTPKSDESASFTAGPSPSYDPLQMTVPPED